MQTPVFERAKRELAAGNGRVLKFHARTLKL